MAQDVFRNALWRDRQINIAVATTTRTCETAQRLHQLGSTATIALGRLMTAAALCGLIVRKPGLLSLQVVGQGKLGQVFADVTHEGKLRGYVKNPVIAFPLLPGEDGQGRRACGHAVGRGSISMIRGPDDEPFVQSATELVTGEIDEDVEHFVTTSDQVSTVLACEVLLDREQRVTKAAGFMAQLLPGGDAQALAALGEAVHAGRLAALMQGVGDDAAALLREIAPAAQEIEQPIALTWQCRCSYERVLGAFRMLGPADLAELIEEAEPVEVTCDFCSKKYQVAPGDIEKVYRSTVRAEG